VAGFRPALREPHSNAIAALRLLARGLAIAGEPRLALTLLCGSELVNVMLQEYQVNPAESARLHWKPPCQSGDSIECQGLFQAQGGGGGRVLLSP